MQKALKVGLAALWLVVAADALTKLDLLGGAKVRMLVLSVAITASVALCVRCMQRPVEDVFEAGREYERRVMLRAMNEHRKVSPIRRVPNGLSAFNRDRVGS